MYYPSPSRHVYPPTPSVAHTVCKRAIRILLEWFFVFILLPPTNEVWGKVIFLHLSVILFTGVWSASVHAGISPPPPPRTRHPLEQTPPWDQAPPEQTPQTGQTPPGTRHPSLEQTPPPPQSRPPRSSACWEIRSTSGRYASYWNAILLLILFL